MIILKNNEDLKYSFEDSDELLPIRNVTSMIVSGNHLQEIKESFKNIPMTDNNTVIWFGEMAEFVYSNYVVTRLNGSNV